jgi:hypothetical protein
MSCWDVGFLSYDTHFTVLSEVTSNFARVYAYSTPTCKFMKDLLHIPVHDVQTLNCPDPHQLNSDFRCYILSMFVVTEDTRTLYTIGYNTICQVPKDMSRHTAIFRQV